MKYSGYMSPEYALEGLFSIKSDVFSFGVLLFEILSGKKNTGFYHSNSLNLIGYVSNEPSYFNVNKNLETVGVCVFGFVCLCVFLLHYVIDFSKD